jgi:hypothetical protein
MSRGLQLLVSGLSRRASGHPVPYNGCMFENLKFLSRFSWGWAGLILIVLNGCATELPATTDSIDSPATLVVGRITTVLTGERKRIYEPMLRTFELENQQTHERFRVNIQSDDEQFALSLPPGKYELSRIQISEGPFMSMAQLSSSFTLERGGHHIPGNVAVWGRFSAIRADGGPLDGCERGG